MKVLVTTLNSKYIHSSLSIKYIYQALKNCCDCEMKEYTINENMEYILSDIVRRNCAVIGFSCYIWNIGMILQISENLKQINPKQIILLGGPEVSFDSKELLQKYPFIDYILSGEGEISAPELIAALSQGKEDLSMVEGLSYRKRGVQGKTQVYVCKEAALIQDLDRIHSPYEGVSEEELKNKIVYYETSRGCVYNCSYCLSSTTKGVRYFPLMRVQSEIRDLVRKKVRQIKFVDRTFNADKQRTLALIRFFKEIDDGRINFHFEVTAHLMDDDLIDELKNARAGLFQLEIGVQSTNPMTLSAINRSDNFRRLSENVQKLSKNHNIHQHLDLIAGLPLEDINSFRKSFNDVYHLRPDMLQLGFLKLLKGSPIRSQTKLFDYRFRSYPPYEVLSNRYLSAEELFYLKEIEAMVDSFYNSSLYFYTMRYLSDRYAQDYFSLFEEINACYKRFYGADKLSRDEGFHLLLRMAKVNEGCKEIDNIFLRDLLRFDFLRMGRNRVLPEFLREGRELISREESLFYLDKQKVRSDFQMQEMHLLEMMKKTHVEKFQHDLMQYIQKEDICRKESIIVFDYSGRKDINDKVPFSG